MKATLLLALGLLPAAASAGTIAFEIVDYRTNPQGIVIAAGVKTQSPADLASERRDGPGLVLWHRALKLDKGLSFGFSEDGEKRFSGFGMWVETVPDSFSWDWFRRHGGLLERLLDWLAPRDEAVFDKIQEAGQLRVRTKESADRSDIAEIEFLSDVSLRASAKDRSFRLLFRVNIKKGSVLTVLP